MATCPECDAEIEVDEFDVDKGDLISCPIAAPISKSPARLPSSSSPPTTTTTTTTTTTRTKKEDDDFDDDDDDEGRRRGRTERTGTSDARATAGDPAVASSGGERPLATAKQRALLRTARRPVRR